VEAKDIQKSPNGVDTMGNHYRLQPNDIKEYKNHSIKTKDMLIDRKFKNLGKKS
jgi:hypothetical protein